MLETFHSQRGRIRQDLLKMAPCFSTVSAAKCRELFQSHIATVCSDWTSLHSAKFCARSAHFDSDSHLPLPHSLPRSMLEGTLSYPVFNYPGSLGFSKFLDYPQ